MALTILSGGTYPCIHGIIIKFKENKRVKFDVKANGFCTVLIVNWYKIFFFMFIEI